MFVCVLIGFVDMVQRYHVPMIVYNMSYMSYNSCYNEGGVYMSHDRSLTLPESDTNIRG